MDSSASPKPEQPTASTNAAAIADLLGNPTAQQQPVGKSSRRGWVWLLVLLPLVVTGVFLSPRLLEFLPETNQTADLTGMPLYTVQRRNLQITVTEEGSLVSDENVDITCDVAGGATIIWLVDDGDRVAEGMDIVKLDASVLSENATAQKIAYEKARALMIQADKDYEAAKIAVEENNDKDDDSDEIIEFNDVEDNKSNGEPKPNRTTQIIENIKKSIRLKIKFFPIVSSIFS